MEQQGDEELLASLQGACSTQESHKSLLNSVLTKDAVL